MTDFDKMKMVIEAVDIINERISKKGFKDYILFRSIGDEFTIEFLGRIIIDSSLEQYDTLYKYPIKNMGQILNLITDKINAAISEVKEMLYKL